MQSNISHIVSSTCKRIASQQIAGKHIHTNQTRTNGSLSQHPFSSLCSKSISSFDIKQSSLNNTSSREMSTGLWRDLTTDAAQMLRHLSEVREFEEHFSKGRFTTAHGFLARAKEIVVSLHDPLLVLELNLCQAKLFQAMGDLDYEVNQWKEILDSLAVLAPLTDAQGNVDYLTSGKKLATLKFNGETDKLSALFPATNALNAKGEAIAFHMQIGDPQETHNILTLYNGVYSSYVVALIRSHDVNKAQAVIEEMLTRFSQDLTDKKVCNPHGVFCARALSGVVQQLLTDQYSLPQPQQHHHQQQQQQQQQQEPVKEVKKKFKLTTTSVHSDGSSSSGSTLDVSSKIDNTSKSEQQAQQLEQEQAQQQEQPSEKTSLTPSSHVMSGVFATLVDTLSDSKYSAPYSASLLPILPASLVSRMIAAYDAASETAYSNLYNKGSDVPQLPFNKSFVADAGVNTTFQHAPAPVVHFVDAFTAYVECLRLALHQCGDGNTQSKCSSSNAVLVLDALTHIYMLVFQYRSVLPHDVQPLLDSLLSQYKTVFQVHFVSYNPKVAHTEQSTESVDINQAKLLPLQVCLSGPRLVQTEIYSHSDVLSSLSELLTQTEHMLKDDHIALANVLASLGAVYAHINPINAEGLLRSAVSHSAHGITTSGGSWLQKVANKDTILKHAHVVSMLEWNGVRRTREAVGLVNKAINKAHAESMYGIQQERHKHQQHPQFIRQNIWEMCEYDIIISHKYEGQVLYDSSLYHPYYHASTSPVPVITNTTESQSSVCGSKAVSDVDWVQLERFQQDHSVEFRPKHTHMSPFIMQRYSL